MSQAAAVVTGASSGIGAELAKLCAREGADVVLIARRQDRLDALAKQLAADHRVKTHCLALDLAAPDSVERVTSYLEQHGIDVDVLINNAGFGSTGPFAEAEPAREAQMVALNVGTVVSLTRALLPRMLARRSGRILNVGSTAGFVPGPFMATYYASKAFVNSFSEALAYELKGTGVTVTVSCPGPVATEFAGTAGNEESNLFKKNRPAPPERIAREAYAAMRAGKPMVVHGLRFRLMLQSLRFGSRRMMCAIAAGLNRPAKRA